MFEHPTIETDSGFLHFKVTQDLLPLPSHSIGEQWEAVKALCVNYVALNQQY
uniref:Uncharacterized protein n=1 Tax=Anguilla anguilla TaxID=7936 RepID=A0A0E9SLI3_ANGAN